MQPSNPLATPKAVQLRVTVGVRDGGDHADDIPGVDHRPQLRAGLGVGQHLRVWWTAMGALWELIFLSIPLCLFLTGIQKRIQ